MGSCCNNNEMFFCLCSDLSCSQKQSEFARLWIRLVWFIVGPRIGEVWVVSVGIRALVYKAENKTH